MGRDEIHDRGEGRAVAAVPTIATHELRFDGALLQRGFWLYVWEVSPPKGEPMHYVGRTGDASSPNAQSPFARMAQHLGFAKTSMMLRKHLDARGVSPPSCTFRLIAHGPILPEAECKTREVHDVRRDTIAAMERALCEEMKVAGYDVLNKVNSKKPLDVGMYESVRVAFMAHFPKLSTLRVVGGVPS